MKLSKPKNANYCATVVEINKLVALENCDNVQHAIIMGNCVVVSKDVKVGDIGLYFPVETALSKEYLSANNLYKHSELNLDQTQKGYFENSGRIKCVKFRGNKSEGLFMPIRSIEFTDYLASDFDINDEFDMIGSTPICEKYIPRNSRTQGSGNKRKSGKKPKESKIIENQFRFHQDTGMLYKNLHVLKPIDVISITYKLHGTSGISSKILCKRKLTFLERILKRVGVKIEDKQYDYINSSRKVLKNDDLNPNPNGFYQEDIWGLADKELREFIQDGMTLYYEIVGYLPSGQAIQKDYDYGRSPMDSKTFDIYIYRITYTNPTGKVFEFSAKQVQDWCQNNGLKPVPELYYGSIANFYRLCTDKGIISNIGGWREELLSLLKDRYNEKDCCMCTKKVPEEGCVVRIEKNEFEAYKCKSNRFYERETKQLDKGELDIETEN